MTATPWNRLSLTLIATAAALTLAACNKSEETPGEKLDQAIEQSRDAAADAATATGTAMDNAAQAASEAATNAGQAMQESATAVGQAASEAATSMGEALDDAGTTAKVKLELAKDPEISALAINVDTQDMVVTLDGKVPNAAAKDRAEAIAKAVTGVTSVNNLLTTE